MKAMVLLLAEASLAMALFYAVYHFLLRGESFLRANRVYLVGALWMSLLLPLFPFRYTVEKSMIDGGAGNPAGLEMLAAGGGADTTGVVGTAGLLPSLLLWVYLAGVVVVLARLAIETAGIAGVIYTSGISRYGRYRIIRNNRYPLPFSFFGLIFFNPAHHGSEELTDIVAHEEVHIRERHWADLLTAELFTAVFWFNPFVWLLERAIRQNHEYLADQGVLAQGRPPGRYQALLINQLMGVPVMGFTHPLHYGLNTNRFKMMTQPKKSKKRALRLMWALPAAAMLSVAFAKPVYEPLPGAGEPHSTLQETPITSQQETKVTGKVVTSDGTPLPGASVVIGGSTSGTLSGADGSFELLVPAGEITLYISFVGYRTVAQKISGDKPANLQITMKEEVFVLHANPGKEMPPPPPPPPVTKSKTPATKSTTSPSDEEEVFIIVESMPEYPGGQPALNQHVAAVRDRLKKEGSLSGSATVEFTVNAEGIPVKAVITEQSNPAAGEAALTTIKEMKPWKPATQRGKTVPVKYQLKLEF